MNLPKKRFGQHFLRDPYYIAKIIEALDPNPKEDFVEIGPGQGALTVGVLKEVPKLHVVEIDQDVLVELKRRTQSFNGLQIHHADALDFDFSSLRTEKKLRIFGNLPYNISTPLLFSLLSQLDVIEDMLFMLQKEVADRLAASISTKDYGRLSVMVQYYCQVDKQFEVPREAFFPPPKVTSAIVYLKPKEERPLTPEQETLFATLVREAFSHRRKTLRNCLKSMASDACWQRAGINPALRAENLTVDQFVLLTKTLSN